MAAPSVTALANPAGIALENGYRTAMAFDRLPTFSVFEKQVTPPEVDGGEPIDTTTMRRTKWRTHAPSALLSLKPFTYKGAYDPNMYNQVINTLINQPGSITIWFPDNSTVSFFGYLQKATPETHENDSKQPEITITVVPTNWDPINKVEAAPAIASVSGT